jgi:acyl-CoA thioester hydrolase
LFSALIPIYSQKVGSLQDITGNGVEVEESLTFISKQTVYWDMLDLLGVLHNARYVVMFERARFDFWSNLGVGPEAPGFDWPYVVARNEVNYKSAIRTEQEVAVTVRIQQIRNSSVTFEHSVVDEHGVVSADGTTTLVRVDAETYRPVSWSDRFRTMVGPYIIR